MASYASSSRQSSKQPAAPTQTIQIQGKPVSEAGGVEPVKFLTDGSVIITLRGCSFRPIPRPYEWDTRRCRYEAYIEIGPYLIEVFNEQFWKKWNEVNPRDIRLSGSIPDAIRTTYYQFPDELDIISRGLLFLAKSVEYDRDAGTIKIHLDNPQVNGVPDGQHLAATVVDTLRREIASMKEAAEASDDQADDVDDDDDSVESKPAYLAAEIWTGLTRAEAARMADGRNTSKNVPPYSVLGLKGSFDDIKAHLKKEAPAGYVDLVAFKPHEHCELSDDPGSSMFKPLSVVTMMQLEALLDIKNYDKNNHPIVAYDSKNKIIRFWDPSNSQNRLSEYQSMLPVLVDVLFLNDAIRACVEEVYNAKKSNPRYWRKVLMYGAEAKRAGGKPVRAVDVGSAKLWFLDPTGETTAIDTPQALIFPMISAFRCLLTKTGNSYSWVGKSPRKWSVELLKELVGDMSVSVASCMRRKKSIREIGRDHSLWCALYTGLESWYEKNKKRL